MVRLFVKVHIYLCGCLRFLPFMVLMIAVAPISQAQGQTFIYTNDNINGANTVTAFSVGSSGTLTSIGSFLTGGSGTGCSSSTGGCFFASNRVTIRGGASFLYASDDGSNDVSAFSINPVNGILSLVPGAPFPTGGSSFGGISLAATPDGRFLMAGSAGSRNIAIFSIAANGSLTLVSTYGPLSNGPTGLKVSPDGAFLAVGGGGGTEVFKIAANGTLSSTTGSVGFSGEEGVDINCAGTALYAAVGNGTGVIDGAALGINGLGGLLPGSPFSNGGLDSSVVLLSPAAGQFLFVSNLGGSVSVFSVASNGSLSQVPGSPFSVGSGFQNSGLAINPAGTLLFTGNKPTGTTANSSISVFSVGTTGSLTAVPGSPFAVAGLNLMSIATFPAPACGNPVPEISQPLSPDSVSPGSAGFTLTVNGTGFVSSSVVNWNKTPLATTFVTRNQLTATVPAANVAAGGTASITVTNTAPGGGTSSPQPFSIAGSIPPAPSANLTFSESSIGVDLTPYSVVVADFNGDGKPDLAIVNSCGAGCNSPSWVSVLLGNGDGTFTLKSKPAVDIFPYLAAAGDFNGDGKLDLIVLNQCGTDTTCASSSPATISILLGNGDGTFQPEKNLAEGLTCQQCITGFVTGDFNGDGKLDFAIAPPNENSVTIFLGNGDGTFTSVATPVNVPSTSLAVGDFNGDGILDLAVINGNGETTLLGYGDGTFLVGSEVPISGLGPCSTTSADFNGDGILDLAVSCRNGNSITILQGSRFGTFTVLPSLISTTSPWNVAATDFNGDGKIDLVVPNYCGNPSCTAINGDVTVFLGNGDGTFSSGAAVSVGLNPTALGIADFNADGHLDVAAVNTNSNSVSILLQAPIASLSTTSLSFGNQYVATTSAPLQVTVANTGSAPLVISGLGQSTPSDFALSSNTCSSASQIEPGATCLIAVTFTPTQIGVRTGSVSLLDNAAGSQTVSLTGIGFETLVVSTNLQGATAGATYNQTLQVSGGTAPYKWMVSAGTLPLNLTLSAAGLISGTTTTAGTSTFTVQVTDSLGTTATQALSIVVAPALAITTTILPAGFVGAVYSQTLHASGGTQPLNWSVSLGSLPSGLSLSAGGVVSGTPNTAGTFAPTVQVVDANGSVAVQQFSIQIVLQLLITTPSTLPAGTAGQPYSQALQVTGGIPPYTFTVLSGALPNNLALIGGAFSGTPNVIGPFNFAITVTDTNNDTSSQQFSLTINPGLPTCAVTLQGSADPLTITAATNCVDPQGESLITTIDWGDGSQQTTGSGGTLTPSHTYPATQQSQTYVISVTSIDTSALQGSVSTSFAAAGVVPPVVPGQSANLNPSISGGVALGNAQVTVAFQCASVTKSDGSVIQGAQNITSALGIACGSNPPTETLTAAAKPVSIVISTTGSGHASLVPTEYHRTLWYAVWLPIPAMILLGGFGSLRRLTSHRLIVIMLLCLLSVLMSCGGGFNVPQVTETQTPAGAYQVTVVNQLQPPTQSGGSGFVQTSLIVPLTVSPAP